MRSALGRSAGVGGGGGGVRSRKRNCATSQPAAAATNSATSRSSDRSNCIFVGGCQCPCASFGCTQCAAQSSALVEQLGDPVDAPEQAGEQTADECDDQREPERRGDTQERELHVDATGVHGADQKRNERSECYGEVEENAGHRKRRLNC